MTSSAARRELRNVLIMLEWLKSCEEEHNSDWRFTSAPYSKRRARLVRMYWALKRTEGPHKNGD